MLKQLSDSQERKEENKQRQRQIPSLPNLKAQNETHPTQCHTRNTETHTKPNPKKNDGKPN